MTSPDDQLDGIFSQIAAQDQVDPEVFEQTLEAAFDYTGAGFDELIPDGDSDSFDSDPATDDLYVGDLTDDPGLDDASDDGTSDDDSATGHTDTDDFDAPVSADDHTAGDDLFT